MIISSRSGAEQGVRVVAVGFGVLCIGWGIWQVAQLSLSDLISAGAWFTVPVLISDLVLLPIVAVIGGLLTRRLPASVRLPAQVALAMIGCLLLIALPFLTGLGKKADNPSLLDRNYPLGFMVYVLIIVAGAGIWALVRWRTAGLPGGPVAPDNGPINETTW